MCIISFGMQSLPHFIIDSKCFIFTKMEALDSGMCDGIKIRLKRRDERRSEKGNP